MEEDGKQNETAPKQPPTSLPPNAGGAAWGPGGAAQAKAVQADVISAAPKEKAASVGAVPRGGSLLDKRKPIVVLSLNGVAQWPTGCSNGVLMSCRTAVQLCRRP
jgi:hypothetical protein